MARPVIKMPSLLLVAVWLAVLGKPSSCAPMQGFNPLAREVEGFLSEPIEGAGSFASNAVETYSHQPRHYHSFDDPNEVYLQAAHHSAPFDAGTPRSYQSYPETRHGAYYGGPMNAHAANPSWESWIDPDVFHLDVPSPSRPSRFSNDPRIDDNGWNLHVQYEITRRAHGLPARPVSHKDVSLVENTDPAFMFDKESEVKRGNVVYLGIEAERRIVEERVKAADHRLAGVSWLDTPSEASAAMMGTTRARFGGNSGLSGVAYVGPRPQTQSFDYNEYTVQFRFIPWNEVQNILGPFQGAQKRGHEWWFHVVAFPRKGFHPAKDLGLMQLT